MSQVHRGVAGRHLLLYDGVCGLCNGVVRFLLPRDRAGVFVFAPLQSATGRSWLTRFGANPDALDTFVVITNYGAAEPRILTRSDAALFVAHQLAAPWRVLAALRIVPRAVRDRIYNVVARHRYRVFGRYDTCPLPKPAERARFVDI